MRKTTRQALHCCAGGPNIDAAGLDEVLNEHGADGWELASAFDINRGHGATGALLVMFKRPR